MTATLSEIAADLRALYEAAGRFSAALAPLVAPRRHTFIDGHGVHLDETGVLPPNLVHVLHRLQLALGETRDHMSTAARELAPYIPPTPAPPLPDVPIADAAPIAKRGARRIT